MTEAAGALLRGVLRLSRRLRLERPAEAIALSKLGVLAGLLRNGAMTATALARSERIQPQSLTRLIAEIEDQGLIRRRRNPQDRRQILIELTAEGAAVVQTDLKQRRSWLAAAMAQGLEPGEREKLKEAAGILVRLAAADTESSSRISPEQAYSEQGPRPGNG